MIKSTIREVLTEKEINDCLRQAFQALPAEDQKNIQLVIDELIKIPRLGPVSALNLLFAVDQAPTLARLDEVLKGG